MPGLKLFSKYKYEKLEGSGVWEENLILSVDKLNLYRLKKILRINNQIENQAESLEKFTVHELRPKLIDQLIFQLSRSPVEKLIKHCCWES